MPDHEDVTQPVSPASQDSSIHFNDALHVGELISFRPVRSVQIIHSSGTHNRSQIVFTDVPSTPSGSAGRQSRTAISEADGPNLQQRNTARSWLSRLGLRSVLTLSFGTVLILGAFGFLTCLWYNKDQTWQSISLDNWTIRSISITAITVQVAVVCQAAVASTVIAAIELEKQDSTKNRFAQLAIIRATAAQPHSLLARRLFSWTSYPLILATIALSLTTLALQFTSTILFTDLKVGTIAQRLSSDTILHYGLSSDQNLAIEDKEPSYSKVIYSTFPTFAEYANSPGIEDGIDDTGETVRALLPLQASAQRESLASYTGYATLWNGRVICMAPSITNVTYTSTGPSISPSSSRGKVQGLINMGGYLPHGMISTFSDQDSTSSAAQDRNLSFLCSFQFAQSAIEWPISLCSIENQPTDLNITFPYNKQNASDSFIYVLLNHTMNGTIPIAESVNVGSGSSIGYEEVSISNWTMTKTESGPWIDLIYPADSNFSIQVSLCFSSLDSIDTFAEANGKTNRSDPTVDASAGRDVPGLEVSELLSQLNASGSNLSTHQRGILDLKSHNQHGSNADVSSALDRDFGFSSKKFTYGLCTFCGSYAAEPTEGAALGVSYILSVVFQQALQRTNSPARALQAILTIARQNQYQSRLPAFDMQSSSTIKSFTQAYFPFQHSGLLTVGLLLCVHFILVTVLVVLFLKCTSKSLLHQSWQSIAQIAALMDEPGLHHAATATDCEFEAWMESRKVEKGVRSTLTHGVT